MSSKKVVKHIMERIAIGAKNAKRLAGNMDPTGFNHALQLASIDPSRTFWNEETMTLTTKYKIIPEICWNGQSSASLSTYLALIDEHSTQAVFGAKSNSLRAGVSVQLQADLFHAVPAHSEVELVSSVTRMGRNLAFCSAQLASDGGDDRPTVYCRGAHVKYLPLDGIVLDVLAGPSGWPYAKAYFDRLPEVSPTTNPGSLRELITPYLTMREPGIASFEVAIKHTNQFLSLHGGCNAILMEMVRQQVADEYLGGPTQLKSLQVQYHTAGKHQVDLRARVVSHVDNELVMQVLVTRPGEGKVVSEGTLRWTRVAH